MTQEVKAQPLKRMHLRNAADKPDLVVMELETKTGSQFFTIDVAEAFQKAGNTSRRRRINESSVNALCSD